MVISALLVFVLLPSFRRTAARSIALVTALYLAPFFIFMIFLQAAPPDWYSIADPVQITLVLLGLALLMAVWNSLSPSRPVAWWVIIALAVVPFIVVHAGLLLPAIFEWSSRYVLIAAGWSR